jgi:hypothetical protein
MFNYLSFSDIVNTKHLRCSLYWEHFVIITLWFVIKCGSVLYLGLQCFCCTILRDAIFVEACSASVISTTCILQHAVVCWVTAAGIRAIALTLGWKPGKGIEPVGV